MKTIYALIVDDNPVVGEAIQNRMATVNDLELKFADVAIVPKFLRVNYGDIKKAAEDILLAVTQYSISMLLLDREFHVVWNTEEVQNQVDHQYLRVIDPAAYANRLKEAQDPKTAKLRMLYSRQSQTTPEHMESALALLKCNTVFSQIKSVIVYSYNRDSSKSAEVVRRDFSEALPASIKFEQVDALFTYSEIYLNANVELYPDTPVPCVDDLQALGFESDFRLYGYFVGEILYRRALALRKRRLQDRLNERKWVVLRKALFLLFIFTGVNIGSSALFESFDNWSTLTPAEMNHNLVVTALAVVFGIVTPLLIFLICPNVLLDLED